MREKLNAGGQEHREALALSKREGGCGFVDEPVELGKGERPIGCLERGKMRRGESSCAKRAVSHFGYR